MPWPRCNQTDQATITQGKDIVFMPGSHQPDTGVILYPGGRCDSRAYAPVMKPLADIGHLVVIPQMPLRLAVLDTNRADKIMAAHPSIRHWIIGGHSMGGAMAAAYVFKHPKLAGDRIKGLFFLASYPSGMHAMPDRQVTVTLIYGTQDMITRKTEFEASRQRLPAHTSIPRSMAVITISSAALAMSTVTATIVAADQQRQVIAGAQCSS